MKTKRDWDALVIELVSIAKEKQVLITERDELAVQLDNLDCENAGFRDEVTELDTLRIAISGYRAENSMLSDENRKFARYLRELGYTTTEIDNIAKGFDL